MRPLGSPSDEVVARAIHGDPEALTILLEEFGPLVRKDIATRVPAKWRSVLSEDDVMQQTYADAFRGITAFVPLGDGAFKAWLASIAECNLRDARRMLEAEKRGGSRKRIGQVPSDESYVHLLDVISHSGTSPSRQVARGELRETLDRVLETLPEAYQRVIRAYDLEGLPVEDVAKAMGRSPGAIYMLRARAHDRLRAALGDEAKFFTDSP